MTLLSFLNLPGLSTRESAEPGFAEALTAVGERLGLDQNYLAAVMSLESGINPKATNFQNGKPFAVGLIQFIPSTAEALGTSTDALQAMTAIQQLPFVEKFYEGAGRGIQPSVPGDYYMATFMPAYVGKPADFVIAERGMPVYDQNVGLDVDKDGTLTVGDVWAKIDNAVAAARARAPFTVDTATQKKSLPPSMPAARAPSLPSPSSASQSASSGQPFGSVGERGASMTRELIVFAASCELEDMNLIVSSHADDAAHRAALVAARVDAYWRSALPDTFVGPHPPQWCGAFALWCLHQAGIATDVHWAFGPPHFGFLWRLRELGAHETPQAGDIAYLDKPYQHHAIVVTAEGDNVRTIDGNQGAATPITTHAAPRSHWTAFFSIAALLELEPPKEAA